MSTIDVGGLQKRKGIYIYIYICINKKYIYVCMHMCVCVCVCVSVTRNRNHETTASSLTCNRQLEQSAFDCSTE